MRNALRAAPGERINLKRPNPTPNSRPITPTMRFPSRISVWMGIAMVACVRVLPRDHAYARGGEQIKVKQNVPVELTLNSAWLRPELSVFGNTGHGPLAHPVSPSGNVTVAVAIAVARGARRRSERGGQSGSDADHSIGRHNASRSSTRTRCLSVFFG